MNQKLLHAFYEIIPEAKQKKFDEIAALRTKHLTVILENIYQEHNASAVLRSCDCFGIQELHVVESENQYKVQRDIARGAGQWVDLFNYDQGEAPLLVCINGLKKRGYKIAALTPDANSNSVFDLPLDEPIALLFGTEWEGISDEARSAADYSVSIPMVGFTESFNLEEQIDLKTRWCQKYKKNGDVVRRELEKRLLEE